MTRSQRLILLLLTPLATVVADEQQSYPLISIEDGDTLVVEMKGEPIRIQLTGIDAPEDVENPKLAVDLKRTSLPKDALIAIGQQATSHLKSLVALGQQVRLEGDLGKRDRYGRLSALVFVTDSVSLNQQMVEDGYASVLGRYPLPPGLKKALENAEAEAILNARGLWGSSPETARPWRGLPK